MAYEPHIPDISYLTNGRYSIVCTLPGIESSEVASDVQTMVLRNHDDLAPSRFFGGRLLNKNSAIAKQLEDHLALARSAGLEEPNQQLLVPRDIFTLSSNDKDQLLYIYEELLGPSMWHQTLDMGPENEQYPAKMIRKIAYQALEALSMVHKHHIVCGLSLASLVLTYSSDKFSSQEDVMRFYGQNSNPNQDSPGLNETATGPEDSDFDVDAFNVCLDILDTKAWESSLGKSVFQSPEMMFDDRVSLATDVWFLGSIITDLAAQTPHFDSVICGESKNEFGVESEAVARLLNSRSLLGELPGRYLTKIGPNVAKLQSYDEEALLNRIQNNPLADDGLDEYRFSESSLRLLVDLLKGMLAYDPDQRITAEQALKHEFFLCDV